jgi:hypothetical protein
MFHELLGNGNDLGITITYKIQESPKGIADAFLIGEDFIQNDSVCLILGDNVFYGQSLTMTLENAQKNIIGATIFGYPVNNPTDFGVVEFDSDLNATISNEFCMQFDTIQVIDSKDRLQDFEVTLFGNIKSSVEAIPDEAVDLSLSKYTSNKPFAFNDNRSTIPMIYHNLPTINNEIAFTNSSGVRFWRGVTIANSTLYYLDSVFTRVHENASFDITDTVNSDTVVNTSVFSITPGTPNIVNRQNQLLGVAVESGLPRLTAELFMVLFSNVQTKTVSFQTNFTRYSSNIDMFFNPVKTFSINLQSLNLIKNKTLFENESTTFIVTESELDFNGNTSVTAMERII